ncbi:hypothetical protein B0T25DRAFT_547742 [Lasiosphaeria hispida]|uniref:Secreted protein n=1 Tax=Lasiosphaeria hispida TaxID=260671 RepID=A0AAJ0HEE0_9PEZI|nr:hypothetical protein B0T25DRAFT_547742 [Lasiosphaeria hispida]
MLATACCLCFTFHLLSEPHVVSCCSLILQLTERRSPHEAFLFTPAGAGTADMLNNQLGHTCAYLHVSYLPSWCLVAKLGHAQTLLHKTIPSSEYD